jgi:hypothetical protein
MCLYTMHHAAGITLVDWFAFTDQGDQWVTCEELTTAYGRLCWAMISDIGETNPNLILQTQFEPKGPGPAWYQYHWSCPDYWWPGSPPRGS